MDAHELEALLMAAAAGDPEPTARADIVLEQSYVGDGLAGWRARPASGPVGGLARALLVWAEHGSFARWLPRGLADLARAAGWHTTPPSVDALVFAVSHALMDGLLALDPEEPPTVAREGDALVLRLATLAFPTHARDRVTVRVPVEGPATSSREAAPPPPEPIPIDATTALERALAGGEVMVILRAVRGLQGIEHDRARRALARAAVLPSEAVAAEALLKLAPDPAAGEALRQALADLPEHRRDAARALAEALLGPGALA